MTDALMWYGHWVSRRRLLGRATSLIASGILWLLLFLVLPGVVLVVVAFMSRDADGQIVWSATTENFRRLLGFGILGWSADNGWIFLRSLWVAGVTTLVAVGLAYPTAFFIAASSPRLRYVWLSLVVVPMCTNLVVRTYAWELLLSPQLPPSMFAAWLGLIEPGRALYPNPGAVYVGLASTALPFAVLPLYTNVERLDWAIVEAAEDLYASRTRVFFQAILPQTLPGLSVAVILTFVPACGMFVITDRLGGSNFWLVGNLIQQQFGPSRDIPYGSAVCIVLIVLTLLGLYLYRRRGKAIELV
ncbi:MAG: ABC transporter permease [Phycisphaeraceae bacterium]|nr:ABC transporter permease [Phycisphaeraceae bacterium]